MSLSFITPTSWRGTIDEFRGFDYFRVQTSEDLAYSLNSSLEELVLQTSHHHEAIRHAAIALGSLGQTIRLSDCSPCGGRDIFLKRHEFACRQYYQAIKILQKDIEANDKDLINFALISCFLFIVFEFLQGNDQSATTHLQSGLNILRQHNLADCEDYTSRPPTKLHPIQAKISCIFRILQAQATMWRDLRSFNPRSYVSIDSPMSGGVVPESFVSLDEACDDLNNIINRVYNFRCRSSRHDFARTRSHVPISTYEERNSLLTELDVHRRRLCIYLESRQTSVQHPEDPQRITVLRINRKVTTLMLATYLEPFESSFYAQSQPHFWQIVSLSTLILRPETCGTRQTTLGVKSPSPYRATIRGRNMPHQRHILSFFAGLIQPLYFTAIKCSDRGTALKAVELLEMEPWREGSWDSAATAQLARARLQDPQWNQGTATGRDSGQASEDEGLSVEWPLATDPLITYPA